MALTRDFKDTLGQSLSQDAAFRVAYLVEAIECLYNGEFAVGQSMLRDYVNGTLGFAALSAATEIPAKSLMRILSAKGNPHADKLFSILTHLQKAERLRVSVVPATKVRKASRPALRSAARQMSRWRRS